MKFQPNYKNKFLHPKHLFLWILLGCAFNYTPIFAQPTGQMEKFQLADAYIRAGQAKNAIPLLEDLLENNKQEYTFYDKLKEAYLAQKRFEDALRLVNDRLAMQPQTQAPQIYMIDKAAVLFKMGKEAESMSTYDATIASNPKDENLYRMVYYSLYRERLFDPGIRYLEAARTQLNNPKIFTNELAYSYGYSGKFEQAIAEYLNILTDSPQSISYVKIQLSQLDQQEGALPAFINGIERAIRTNPLNKEYRDLAAWLYLEAKDYRKALNANVAIDRLENQNGVTIYVFGLNAANAGYFEVAEEAYKIVMDQFADAPIAPNAFLALAQLAQKRGEAAREQVYDPSGKPQAAPNYQASIEAYQQFVNRYPQNGLMPQVLFEMGSLEKEPFMNLDRASALFMTLKNNFPNTQYAYQAEYELGDIAVLENNLPLALSNFQSLNSRLRLGELAEQSQYQLVLIEFYRGHFEFAEAMVKAIDMNTTTDVANDAIELKVVLHENRGPDSLDVPLKMYARAKLWERQHKFGDAMNAIDSLLVQFKDHELVDEANFMKAGLLRAQGQFIQALDLYKNVQLKGPKSYLADRSLFAIAEIYDLNLKDKTKAIEAYADVLTLYPGSMLLPEIRTRIRKLRGDAVNS
jgi:tetratricopeptide (TPR) repeat protein